jgi:Eukaryotic aspartyl protease
MKGWVWFNYYTDDIALGSSTIKAQQFGVATSSAEEESGILGLGPPMNSMAYPSILENLQAQGQIKGLAFSLDLRSIGYPYGILSMPLGSSPLLDGLTRGRVCHLWWSGLEKIQMQAGEEDYYSPESNS